MLSLTHDLVNEIAHYLDDVIFLKLYMSTKYLYFIRKLKKLRIHNVNCITNNIIFQNILDKSIVNKLHVDSDININMKYSVNALSSSHQFFGKNSHMVKYHYEMSNIFLTSINLQNIPLKSVKIKSFYSIISDANKKTEHLSVLDHYKYTPIQLESFVISSYTNSDFVLTPSLKKLKIKYQYTEMSFSGDNAIEILYLPIHLYNDNQFKSVRKLTLCFCMTRFIKDLSPTIKYLKLIAHKKIYYNDKDLEIPSCYPDLNCFVTKYLSSDSVRAIEYKRRNGVLVINGISTQNYTNNLSHLNIEKFIVRSTQLMNTEELQIPITVKELHLHDVFQSWDCPNAVKLVIEYNDLPHGILEIRLNEPIVEVVFMTARKVNVKHWGKTLRRVTIPCELYSQVPKWIREITVY